MDHAVLVQVDLDLTDEVQRGFKGCHVVRKLSRHVLLRRQRLDVRQARSRSMERRQS